MWPELWWNEDLRTAFHGQLIQKGFFEDGGSGLPAPTP
jgi:hypothetical protein